MVHGFIQLLFINKAFCTSQKNDKYFIFLVRSDCDADKNFGVPPVIPAFCLQLFWLPQALNWGPQRLFLMPRM